MVVPGLAAARPRAAALVPAEPPDLVAAREGEAARESGRRAAATFREDRSARWSETGQPRRGQPFRRAGAPKGVEVEAAVLTKAVRADQDRVALGLAVAEPRGVEEPVAAGRRQAAALVPKEATRLAGRPKARAVRLPEGAARVVARNQRITP